MSSDSRNGRPSEVAWSPWGERLVALSAIGATLGLGHAWMTQYENREGNGFYSQNLSGPIQDLMPIPPDTQALEPLVGLHYFSDLQLAIAYGKTANPYLIDYPAQYPPLGILEFRVLGLLGYQASLWLFLVLAVGLLSFTGWRLMSDLSRPRKIINLFLLVILTPAMIMSVDRGALSPVAIGMVGLALVAAQRKRWLLASLILVLAISLKPYLALVLLYPLFRGFWRFAIGTGLATGLINLVAFTLFPGGFLDSVRGFVQATLRYADSGAAADQAETIKFLTLDSVSGTGTVLRIIAWWKNIDVASMIYDDFNDLIWLPAVFFLLALIVILLNRRLPYWIPLTLVLATSTVVFPATPLYTLSWATLGAFYFGSTGSDPFPVTRGQSREGVRISDRSETLLRVSFLIALVLCLTPTFWMIPGLQRGDQDAAGLLGPLAVLIATGLVLVVSIRDFTHFRQRPSSD